MDIKSTFLVITAVLLIFFLRTLDQKNLSASDQKITKKRAEEPEYTSSLVKSSLPVSQDINEEMDYQSENKDKEIFTENIQALDLNSKVSMFLQVESIKAIPHFPEILVNTFRNLTLSEDLKRDKILFVAGKLNPPEMLTLWESVITRKPPRFADEDHFLELDRPTLESRLIRVERLQAIKKLGQIAYESKEARSVLLATALGENVANLSVLEREQAAKILQESDSNGILKVFSRLKDNDPLRERLQQRE